jgi:hypothetical protein
MNNQKTINVESVGNQLASIQSQLDLLLNYTSKRSGEEAKPLIIDAHIVRDTAIVLKSQVDGIQDELFPIDENGLAV